MTRARALVPRPTPAQKKRRLDVVVRMVKDGYSTEQIATAMQVNRGTVTSDRNERRAELRNAPKTVPPHRRKPDPEPVDWWSEPEPGPLPPSYVTTSPVPRIEGLLEYLRDTNARNRLAFSITEAEAAGDEAYLVGLQLAILDLITYLQGLHKVAQSERAQEEAKKPHARDDLMVRDRFAAITDPRTRASLVNARPLPQPGTGELPGRMYCYLWGYIWAGLPLDENAVRKAASREGNNLERARAAVAEMRRAFGHDVQEN